uniref:Reticulon n=1 Tax=Poecilia reticulata TaxID=8081 RepID=A0A3P9PHP6_POERE
MGDALKNLADRVEAYGTNIPNASALLENLVKHSSVGVFEATLENIATCGELVPSFLKSVPGTSGNLINDLIHWRDPKKSGMEFSLSLLLLLSLAAYSVISVVSYMLLALLCVAITFRIYTSVVQAVELIEKDVTIPPETYRKHHSIYIHKRNDKQLCKSH